MTVELEFVICHARLLTAPVQVAPVPSTTRKLNGLQAAPGAPLVAPVAVTCTSTPNRIALVVTDAAAEDEAVNVALPVASYFRLVNVTVEPLLLTVVLPVRLPEPLALVSVALMVGLGAIAVPLTWPVRFTVRENVPLTRMFAGAVANVITG